MDHPLSIDDSIRGSPLSTAEPWNLVADAYTAELLPLFELFACDAMQLADLPPLPRIIDVATGPGTLALIAAKNGAIVSAIDFSPAMIGQLRQRVGAAGLTAINARVGDGQALPFDDNTYDGAFSLFGLMFFPDRVAGFHELRRVLRPGQPAVVSAWAPYEGPFALMMDGICALLPRLRPAGGRMPLGDSGEFAREMEAAGFRDVEVHTMTHTHTAPSLAAYWETAQRTTAPILLVRREVGEEVWSSFARRLYETLRDQIGEGPVEAPFTAHIGVGIK